MAGPALADDAPGTLTVPDKLDGEMIDLRGEWLFAWGQLIEPEQLPGFQASLLPMKVPGVWGKRGYGTYALTVNLPKEYPRLTLRIPELPSNYKLYIDGQLIMEKGRVGTTEEQSRVARGTEFVNFVPKGQSFQIVLQTSSFFHREGGIWNTIQVAPTDLMNQRTQGKVAFDAFLIGILLIMCAYHLGLFVIRVKDKSSLHFAVFCCVVLLRIMATSDYGFFMRAFPSLDSEWSKRAEFAVIIMGAPIFFSFMRSNYAQQFSQLFERILWILGTLGMLVTCVTQQKIYGYLLWPFEGLVLIGFTLGVVNLARAIIAGRTGSVLSLVGILVFFASAINDVLHTNRVIHTGLTLHIGFSLYILMQALVIAKRFSAAFLKVEADEKIISELNKKLEFQIVKLDELVEQKTAHIKSIFQTIHQAIFTVDKDGHISEERSRFTDGLLRGAGNIKDFLKTTAASEEEKSYVESILISSVGTEEFSFDANAHLLVRRLKRGEEIFEVDWSPILNRKDDTVSSILVCLRDVTEIERLREETQKKDSRILILAELIGAPAVQQQKNIQSLHKMMSRIDSLADQPNALRDLLIELHTFKGNTRFFGFKSLSGITHEAESAVLAKPEEARAAVGPLQSVFSEYKEIFDRNIGVHLKQGVMHVDRAILEGLYRYFSGKSDLSATEHMFLDRLERELHARLDALVEAQAPKLKELATKLGKETPEIKVSGRSMVIPDQFTDTLMKMFNHLVRNSLDHGIENAGERQRSGKTPQGHIEVQLKQKGGMLEIDYSDDGRGYHLAGIKRKAASLGISTEGLSPEQLVGLTAMSQFSTKDEVSDISGRGVGMDAVQAFAREAGGDLLFKVREVKGDYAQVTLTILLPLLKAETLPKIA